MNAKKIWANFSVKDAERTKEFYAKLGFVSSPYNNYPKLASFIFGDDGFVIHFFEHGSQIDKYLPARSKGREIIFTLSAETQDEVQEWWNRVQEAGGKVLGNAERDEAGYYGFVFADPDGHQFNVLLMEAGM